MRPRLVVWGLFLLLIASPLNARTIKQEETKFGRYVDKQVIAVETILFDEALQKRINEIGDRIVRAAGGPEIAYTFRIVNSPLIGANSAAGGFVYVNTGLLDFARTEDELAAVVAHEVHHIIAGHQIELARTPERKKNKCGKEQELAADAFALEYMMKAGYAPPAMLSLLKRLLVTKRRLGIDSSGSTSSFLNAEPGLDARIERIEELLSEPKWKRRTGGQP
ncbi:MAG TPA: M48 family metalloprotease [bacterium]|nr:M48 family metalloprotease [bacterium]